MNAIDTRKQKLIVANVLKACKDIEKLNKTGYDFLYQCNGFIAHYDINGFKAYYADHSLIDDIEQNARANQWNNFRPGESHYEYYMSRREVYNAILGAFVANQFMREHFIFVHVN